MLLESRTDERAGLCSGKPPATILNQGCGRLPKELLTIIITLCCGTDCFGHRFWKVRRASFWKKTLAWAERILFAGDESRHHGENQKHCDVRASSYGVPGREVLAQVEMTNVEHNCEFCGKHETKSDESGTKPDGGRAGKRRRRTAQGAVKMMTSSMMGASASSAALWPNRGAIARTRIVPSTKPAKNTRAK
jgi:hypothetical protein